MMYAANSLLILRNSFSVKYLTLCVSLNIPIGILSGVNLSCGFPEADSITRLCCTCTMTDRRLRNWCFTSYDLENFKVPDDASSFRYCVYQTEECPTTKQWHNQGYIEFSKAETMATVKTLLNDSTCHLEGRRGTRAEARAYCMKADSRISGPIEFGEWTGENERQREDLNAARENIQSKTTWQSVINDPELCRVVSRYGRWAREVYDNRTLTPVTPAIELHQWQIEVFSRFTS